MLKADELLYKPLKPLDQGQSPMCVAYSFFSLLSEFVQQKYDLDVEFDVPLYFELMEAARGKKYRIKYLINQAKTKGYKTTTGEIVKIHGHRTVHTIETAQRQLQYRGPILFTVKRWYGHSLNKDVIEMPKEDAKLKKTAHMMYLNGFYDKGFYFQNSWGKRHQRIPYDVYKYMTKGAYSIYDVTIN
jgi:hypothetical protein